MTGTKIAVPSKASSSHANVIGSRFAALVEEIEKATDSRESIRSEELVGS